MDRDINTALQTSLDAYISAPNDGTYGEFFAALANAILSGCSIHAPVVSMGKTSDGSPAVGFPDIELEGRHYYGICITEEHVKNCKGINFVSFPLGNFARYILKVKTIDGLIINIDASPSITLNRHALTDLMNIVKEYSEE